MFLYLSVIRVFVSVSQKKRIFVYTTSGTTEEKMHHLSDEGLLFLPATALTAGGGATATLIKKKIKFSSYICKFIMEQLQNHI
jgi:hypothetical protein